MIEKTTIKPFDAGNWFPVNNAVFDKIMPILSPNAFKVLCAVIRKTWGWSINGDARDRKIEDQISYSQFIKATGIKSAATISAAIQECLESGMLSRHEVGTQMGKPIYSYKLNTLFTLEIEVTLDDVTSENEVVVTLENEVIAPIVTSKIEDTKQSTLKQKKQKRSAAGAPPHPAITAFREAARLSPQKAAYDTIITTIGDELQNVEFWKSVVSGWILKGWNPRNVGGMIDFYKRHEIPGANGNGAKAHNNGGNGKGRDSLSQVPAGMDEEDWVKIHYIQYNHDEDAVTYRAQLEAKGINVNEWLSTIS